MALLMVATSCKEKEKKQIELLTKENQALRNESHAKDSTINGFFEMLNEIESNLAQIKRDSDSSFAPDRSEARRPDARAQPDDCGAGFSARFHAETSPTNSRNGPARSQCDSRLD